MSEATIIFSDNHESRELREDEAGKLLRYAGCGLKKLCDENPSLLLFPDCLGDHGDGLDDPLFSIVGNRLWTGNIVGFWGIDGVNVRVHSRFDSDERQYFFHYMLQRIAGLNVLDLPSQPDNENLWDFLIYLFPMTLKRAVRQGLFRAYRVFRHNDDRIKGAIDVSRFIRCDIPFSGRVAYSTREHTTNNNVLHLVRHTIEHIRRIAPALLSVDHEMRQAVEAVVRVTPDYDGHSLTRIVAANLRPVRHPFYTAYTGLQKLCLQILRHEKLSFGESDGRISGIVFDAAWLWEEYLNVVFLSNKKGAHVVHPRNKQGENPIYFYKPRRSPHYPDFYDSSRRAVFDAKYKAGLGVERNDLLQMISYLHVMEYGHGCFIKPSRATAYRLDGVINNSSSERIGVYTLAVPQVCDDFVSFAHRLAHEEQCLCELIDRECAVNA